MSSFQPLRSSFQDLTFCCNKCNHSHVVHWEHHFFKAGIDKDFKQFLVFVGEKTHAHIETCAHTCTLTHNCFICQRSIKVRGTKTAKRMDGTSNLSTEQWCLKFLSNNITKKLLLNLLPVLLKRTIGKPFRQACYNYNKKGFAA